MCRRVNCPKCNKPTYTGCGMHVEQVLASLRAAQVRVEDLEIGRPDLEDVFVEIMNGGRPSAAPAQPQAVAA